MQNNADQEEIDYEVGQEQLDAVDRMLEELDMDEQFDRVPAAFRIVERFEQQQDQQRQFAARNGDSNNHNNFSGVNGYHHDNDTKSLSSFNAGGQDIQGYAMQSSDAEEMDHEDSDDEMAGEPFGYIPLDQGDFNGMDDEDEEEDEANDNAGYAQMDSDNENEHGHENGIDLENADEEEDTEQGYDGYLRRRNRDGTVPVPVIPAAVQIDLATLNEDFNEDGTARAEVAAELIPEEDLKTIAMVMNSFSLPAPEWAQSIPEDRWLPRIVQRAEASGSSGSGSGTSSGTTAAAERFDAVTATPSVLATATNTTGTTDTTTVAVASTAAAATATSTRAHQP